MQIDDIIFNLAEITKKMRRISFTDIVEATSKHRLYPINTQEQEDKELIINLVTSCNNFLTLCNKNKRRFGVNRVNEISKSIENEIAEEINKTKLNAEILSEQGYPDIKLTDEYNRITYLEIKASSKTKKDSQRRFYYSSGEKVKSDARHLLLGLLVTEERDKYWKIEKWTLTDLSKLNVSLKAEFNAGNKAIYTKESIIAESK